MSDDLTKMIPTPEPLTIKGEVLLIEPIRVKQLKSTIVAAGPLMGHFKALTKDGGVADLDMYSMISESTDAVLDLVCVLSGKPRAWLDELDLQELVDLTSALVEANIDFFIKNVLPSLLQVMDRVVRKGQLSQTLTPGQVSSSS